MENQKTNKLNQLKIPIILFIFFWTVAILLWQLQKHFIYLFNFGYIGTSIALGAGAYEILPREKKPTGRRLAQLFVGLYLLGYLGVYRHENMQIEGFFFYIAGGIFGASVIHYLIAKVVNPIIIGRGWCGWACWTAMALDYLPYKINKKGRLSSKWEKLRYIHFFLSLAFVLILWLNFSYGPTQAKINGLIWLIAGNVIYFGSGIILAFVLKDNRAFCKYLCPITVILKISSRFALFKMEGDKNKCTNCKACSKTCPMDIEIHEYIQQGKRVLSTECIICQTCTTVCPQNAISMTCKFDMGGKEIIRRK